MKSSILNDIINKEAGTHILYIYLKTTYHITFIKSSILNNTKAANIFFSMYIYNI